MPNKGGFLPSNSINPSAHMSSMRYRGARFLLAGDAILCGEQHLHQSTRLTDIYRSEWPEAGGHRNFCCRRPCPLKLLPNTQLLCPSPLTHTVVSAQALYIHLSSYFSLCFLFISARYTGFTLPILTKFLLIFKNKFTSRRMLNNS